MQLGLLWFDSDPRRGLTAKIQDAARRYEEKFGVTPNACYVNSSALADGRETAVPMALRVIPAINILPHHFWVGVEEGT